MTVEITIEKLKCMKLHGLAYALNEQLAQPNTYDDLGFTERLGMLIDRESIYRQNKRLKKLVSDAKFRIRALPEEIDYQHPRGLVKDKMATLLNGDWLKRNQNILITGPTG